MEPIMQPDTLSSAGYLPRNTAHILKEYIGNSIVDVKAEYKT